ncbi:MAG: hypothetical protein LBG80_12520 [Bacteroidales bacterium]|jgi:hypothetical protein|nr:hypothetical protein [Bacteroidales bacterium]
MEIKKISTPIPRFGVEGRANLFILPNDVSFSALSIGEHSGRYSTSGCFYQDILENPNYALHRVGAPIPLIAPTTGEGTPNHPNYRDTIRAQTSHSGAGIVSIKIPTYYVSQSQNTPKKTFATVSFEGVISTNGFIRTIIVTKQNAQFTAVEKIQP